MQKVKNFWEEYGPETLATAAVLFAILMSFALMVTGGTFTPVSADPEPVAEVEIIPAPVNVGIYDIPAEATSFKAWMPYTAITSTTSAQYRLQDDAWTDGNGFRRYGDEGYYMIALGTYYSEACGKIFDVTFESGTTIRCIVGDIKDDKDTDELHQHRMGNVVEFIVDRDRLNEECLYHGDMSYAKGIDLTGKPTLIRQVF